MKWEVDYIATGCMNEVGSGYTLRRDAWMKREVALHNDAMQEWNGKWHYITTGCMINVGHAVLLHLFVCLFKVGLEYEKYGRKRSWCMHILWNRPRIWQHGLNNASKTSVRISGLGAGNRKRKSWIRSKVTTTIKVRWKLTGARMGERRDLGRSIMRRENNMKINYKEIDCRMHECRTCKGQQHY
jgi:hypothetical protein